VGCGLWIWGSGNRIKQWLGFSKACFESEKNQLFRFSLRKRIFEDRKGNSLGKFFSTFLSLKSCKGLYFSFPAFERYKTGKYPFLPWTIFFSGTYHILTILI
jgi:hypothetical protein